MMIMVAEFFSINCSAAPASHALECIIPWVVSVLPVCELNCHAMEQHN